MFHEPLAQFLGGLLGALACHLHEGEHHHGEVSLKLGARLLQLHTAFGHRLAIQLTHCGHNTAHDLLFYFHPIF